ncbi:hypothetical protein AMJ71_06700 [candidate division TA06 bacterium SM1_40]|uniref:Uncharacterized protein n=2 Tax=Bacteria division TA06 TaxID=1156500 RepID=A0A0S8JI32_UNCT6|nr:MAG: hypothetical protein AMJ71_06700 [candidate division TA06 bacterium SM1_40]
MDMAECCLSIGRDYTPPPLLEHPGQMRHTFTEREEEPAVDAQDEIIATLRLPEIVLAKKEIVTTPASRRESNHLPRSVDRLPACMGESLSERSCEPTGPASDFEAARTPE